MFLNHFDPSDISPRVLIDREDEAAWLRESFETYFDAIERHELDDGARRIVCVTGDKGIGKSILAAKVIADLKRQYSGSTLFVSVDCRRTNGARGVLADIASGLAREIESFRSGVSGSPCPEWLEHLARVLTTIAHADEASSKVLQQRVSAHKAVLKLGGQQMLRLLKAEFDVSVEREKKDVEALETTIKFDVHRLLALTTTLFEDIRQAGLRVFVLLDNVDELQHEYWDEDARQNTRATVKSVLRLVDAPIAMLLCMRTYFQTALPRAVGSPRQLEPLPAKELLAIVDHRVGREAEATRAALRAEPARTIIAQLAERATTPLALLTWVKWVAESRGSFAKSVEAHAAQWRDARYPDFCAAVAATLALFAGKRAQGSDSVSRKELLAALADDEEAFRYLQTTELILPRDFWDPTHFVLDPSAAWIAGLPA
jgi:Cdc6-like AAA superfamily ATPase